jgi:hypothetical protein
MYADTRGADAGHTVIADQTVLADRAGGTRPTTVDIGLVHRDKTVIAQVEARAVNARRATDAVRFDDASITRSTGDTRGATTVDAGFATVAESICARRSDADVLDALTALAVRPADAPIAIRARCTMRATTVDAGFDEVLLAVGAVAHAATGATQGAVCTV